MRIILTITPLIIAMTLISCGPGISGGNDGLGQLAGEILSTSDLVFYARLNEDTGSISDFYGRAIGSPQGSPEYNKPGFNDDYSSSNSAIHFDNTSACFRFGQIDALQLQPPFTIMAMINLDFNPGGQVAILSSLVAGEQEWSFQVSPGPSVNLEWSDNGSTPNNIAGPAIGQNVWELVTVAVNSNGQARFYVNGTFFGIFGTINNPIYVSPGNVSVNIGCEDGAQFGVGGENRFFNGRIDEVAVFKRELQFADIVRIDDSRYD